MSVQQLKGRFNLREYNKMPQVGILKELIASINIPGNFRQDWRK
jgi:hypothetical protein